MDIAAISMSHAQFELQQSVAVSNMSKAMDVAEMQMQGMIEMLQSAVPVPESISPVGLGEIIDVKA